MKKLIVLLVLVCFVSCKKPASTEALKKTNAHMHAIAMQVGALTDIAVKQEGMPITVIEPLTTNMDSILEVTKKELTADLGIWSADSFVNSLINGLEKVSPWLGAISTAFGLPTGVGETITGLAITGLGLMARRQKKLVVEHKEEMVSRKVESDKKVRIAELHSEANIMAHKEVLKKVDEEFKSNG